LERISIFSLDWNPMTGGAKETVATIGGVELVDGAITLTLFLSFRLTVTRGSGGSELTRIGGKDNGVIGE
jgi:hypothetical protein